MISLVRRGKYLKQHLMDIPIFLQGTKAVVKNFISLIVYQVEPRFYSLFKHSKGFTAHKKSAELSGTSDLTLYGRSNMSLSCVQFFLKFILQKVD